MGVIVEKFFNEVYKPFFNKYKDKIQNKIQNYTVNHYTQQLIVNKYRVLGAILSSHCIDKKQLDDAKTLFDRYKIPYRITKFDYKGAYNEHEVNFDWLKK